LRAIGVDPVLPLKQLLVAGNKRRVVAERARDFIVDLPRRLSRRGRGAESTGRDETLECVRVQTIHNSRQDEWAGAGSNGDFDRSFGERFVTAPFVAMKRRVQILLTLGECRIRRQGIGVFDDLTVVVFAREEREKELGEIFMFGTGVNSRRTRGDQRVAKLCIRELGDSEIQRSKLTQLNQRVSPDENHAVLTAVEQLQRWSAARSPKTGIGGD